MSDEVVHAVFEPSEARLLVSSSHTQLLVESPILVSALSNIFPYLLFIDNFLEVITWTNEDPYQNFLIVVCYSILVLYWDFLKYWVLPFLVVLLFTSIVWRADSVIYDSKFGERPTVEEVLLALHNITVRFELFFRPAKNLHFSLKNYYKMALGTLAITPLHVFVLQNLLTPRSFAWIIGTVFLTFHSPWAFSIRRLIWRSIYARIFAHQLTGLDIRLSRRKTDTGFRERAASSPCVTAPATDVEEDSQKVQHQAKINNFSILRKVIVSPTQLKQTVRFDILENERRWLGLGWTKLLYPGERSSFCYMDLMLAAPNPNQDEFEFPVFENDLYTYSWQWMDDEWKIDAEFNKNRSKEGWVFYDSNWEMPKYEDGFSRYTRSRKWVRRAILLIDKQSEVLDG